MTPQRFARIDELFGAASQLPPETRDAYLEEQCGDDAELRAEVAALLAHDEHPPGFLGDVFIDAPSAPARGSQSIAPPERIGRYRIIRKLGEGGFGIVYLAEQDNPRRPVAVKVLRSLVAADSLLKRFDYEAELLGRLAHPGIARIFEADTETTPDGLRAFIAMEYVEGHSLGDHVRSRRPDPREVLDLFARIGDAIEYAHQQGVIHRDLKPHNIIVGADGQPRIVDFGVARDIGPDAGTRLTDAGHLLGTLPYMSPEQLAGDARVVDTRTDIYALGVMLYQMLADRLPYEIEARPLAAVIHQRCNEDPVRLSAIFPALRGEIETIVAKAMERDRDRRYASAGALATDIRRFLAGEPIEAKRDSAMYILRKRLQRYRGAVIAGTMLLAVSIAFGIIAFVQSRRNRTLAIDEAAALVTAREQTRRADDAAQKLTLELRDNHIERGRLLGVTGDFRTAEQLLWSEYQRWPDFAAARWSLWELYARFPLVASLPGHLVTIRSIAVSPDGRWIASGSLDGGLFVWDARSHSRRCLQARNEAFAVALAISPDSRRLASSDSGGNLRLWDFESGLSRAQIKAHEGGANAVAWIGANSLATAGADRHVRLWNAEPLAETDARAVSKAQFSAIAADSAGKQLAAAGEDAIHIFTLSQSPQGPRFAAPLVDLQGSSADVIIMAMSPDGTRLASGGRDQVLRLWKLPSGEVEAALKPTNGTIRGLSFSPDGKTLAETGWWTVDVWDMATHERVFKSPMQAATWDVAFLDARHLVVGDVALGPASLRIWETEPRLCLRRVSAHRGFGRAVAASPDNQLAATGGADNFLRIWRLEDASQVREMATHGSGIIGTCFSPDGKLVAAASGDGWTEAFDVATGKRTACIKAMCAPNAPISFLPDSHKVIVGLFHGENQIWDLDSAKQIAEWRDGTTEILSTVAIPQVGLIATCSRARHVRLWNTVDQSPKGELPLPEDATPWCINASAHGERLATGTWGFTVIVWDLARRAQIADLRGHTQLITGVEFGWGNFSDLLMSCSADGLVKIWDWRAANCVVTLNADSGAASSLAITPDGRRVLVVYANGTLGIWDLSYYDRHIEGNRAGLRRISSR